MKAKVNGNLLVEAAMHFGKYKKVRSRTVKNPGVKCLYNRSWNKSFPYESRKEKVIDISVVDFNFNSAGINIWVIPIKSLNGHSISDWAALQSVEFSYEDLLPWLNKIYEDKMSSWDTAKLLNSFWVPATNKNTYGVPSSGALHKCWEVQYYPYSDP